jgi:hypothetical protein
VLLAASTAFSAVSTDSEWYSWWFFPCQDAVDGDAAEAFCHHAAIPNGPTTPAARQWGCCPERISMRARSAIRVFPKIAIVLTAFAGKRHQR